MIVSLITISIYINGSAFLVVWLGGTFSRLRGKSTASFDQICPFWGAAGAERLFHRWSISARRPPPALGGKATPQLRAPGHTSDTLLYPRPPKRLCDTLCPP